MIIKQDIRPNKMIWVTFNKEGMHKYPAALTDPNLATGDEYDVSFLGYPHRHIFHFKVWIGVTHDDRDIEFIQFKRWLLNLYKDATLSLDFDVKYADQIHEDGWCEHDTFVPMISVKICLLYTSDAADE